MRNGRRHEFARFAAFSDEEKQRQIPDPNALETFTRSKPDWSRVEDSVWLSFYKELLSIRHAEIVQLLAKAGPHAGRILAAGDSAMAIDWQLGDSTLQLRANLGDTEASLPPATGRILFAEADSIAEGSETLPPLSMIYTLHETAEQLAT